MTKHKNFEIVQNLDMLSEEQIIKSLNLIDSKTNINHIMNYAYILHNKDNKKDGSKREPHWHILIKMDNAYSFDTVAKRFDVPIQMVNKINSRFADALNYLTHNTEMAKNEKKYQYDDEEVKSNYSWKTERQKVLNEYDKVNRKQTIIELIANGTIREFNYFNYISDIEYIKFKKEIDLAFKYRKDKMQGVERNMECVFIQGESGSGKTTYAKMLADGLGYSYYISSGSNDVLDNYKGQDCIILDDLRPSCMGLSDLLKMLDNHTASTVKSRYSNKVLECKLIIITTISDLDTFFRNVFSEEKEPIKQLKRRCQTKIKMTDTKMFIACYDDMFGDYGDAIEYKNPINNIYKKQGYNAEEYKARTKFFATAVKIKD